jgi:hypothetical protein
MPLLGLISKVWDLQAIYMTTAIFLGVLSIWAFAERNKVSARQA